ncbi:MAG: BREX-1 system phosphatase PglZ type B [Gemmatimonadetes bacterium]|jgi:hypothetical protein|nr:BREX-1 system phosphatase PglZ type B [Gemmatimonadota bacterium]
MTVSTRSSTPNKARSLIEWMVFELDKATRSADGVAEPAAISWCDADRQWLPLIPRLREVLPQLYTLGSYQQEQRTGPAIWLRCVVERAIPEVSPPPGTIPILYLPGVGRQELRAGSDPTDETIPLVELQYRGTSWHQPNGRDWTVEAALRANDLDVSQDARTREAMLRALPLLSEVELDALRMGRLEEGDFDRLAVQDPVRDVLRWLNDAEACRRGMTPQAWDAFRNVARAQFGVDVERDATADAAARVIKSDPKWETVWTRFCESPTMHPGFRRLLRGAAVEQGELALDASRIASGNDDGERRLRAALEDLARLPHHEACARVTALEAEHGARRAWVWARLHESPYAVALAPLARLAERALQVLGGESLQAVTDAYARDGFRCDRAAVEALGSVIGTEREAVVQGAVRALYLPWVDRTARHFQSLVSAAGALPGAKRIAAEKDVCLLFADGLRFDVADLLREQLEGSGCRVTQTARLSTVPTVTATAKPAVTPLTQAIAGGNDASEFMPNVVDSGQSATTARLRIEMERRGIDVLINDEVRPPSTLNGGWTECGQLDALGHKAGIRLASELGREVERLEQRVRALLDAGWRAVRVVTDHGWLLVPAGLPKIELPAFLTTSRWGRCATVKGESDTSVPTYPWHWNSNVRIASPPGAGAFIAGMDYAHGGVSPQECVIPMLLVERSAVAAPARITDVRWNRLRCRVSVAGDVAGLVLDVRTHWKDATKSIVASPKAMDATGDASVVIPDDSLEGSAAQVVLVDAGGTVIDKRATTVGDAT